MLQLQWTGLLPWPNWRPQLLPDPQSHVAALCTSWGIGGIAAPNDNALIPASDIIKVKRQFVADLGGIAGDRFAAVGQRGVAQPVAGGAGSLAIVPSVESSRSCRQ